MRRTNRRWRHLFFPIALAIVLGGCLAGLRDGRDVDGDGAVTFRAGLT